MGKSIVFSTIFVPKSPFFHVFTVRISYSFLDLPKVLLFYSGFIVDLQAETTGGEISLARKGRAKEQPMWKNFHNGGMASQRAIIGAKIATLSRADSVHAGNNCKFAVDAPTRKQAAELMQVSELSDGSLTNGHFHTTIRAFIATIRYQNVIRTLSERLHSASTMQARCNR
ncbi:MAG: hypothetical protein KZQ92_00405 [Candidatus Thiodiazotropha sp. (ex Lucinoma borealis)]|nr:hypothetical protein [Candidatus Thiodiazotropha sp. (ex Lucinoma borealis)]